MERGVLDKKFEVKVSITWAARSPRRSHRTKKKFGKLTFSIFNIFKKKMSRPQTNFQRSIEIRSQICKRGELMLNQHKAPSAPCLAWSGPGSSLTDVIFFSLVIFVYFCLFLLEIDSPSKIHHLYVRGVQKTPPTAFRNPRIATL